MMRFLAVVTVLALGACAGHAPRTVLVDPPAGAGGGADGERQYICEMQRETGSNIMQRVCRPAHDDTRDRQREQTQIMLNTTPRAAPQQN